jgi:DNA-binding transcriptional ArsR family regulator
MIEKQKRKDNVEVASDQLKAELIEIKERVGALETIASISNRSVVETYVRGCLKSEKGRQVMKECEQPRTRDYLISKLGFASAQALDYHLSPLRENDLIRQRFEDDGTTQTFEWSNLFKRLPKKTLDQVLGKKKT